MENNNEQTCTTMIPRTVVFVSIDTVRFFQNLSVARDSITLMIQQVERY